MSLIQNSSDPLNDPLLQKLFRLFSYFADVCPSGTLTPSQANFILAQLHNESPHPSTSRDIAFDTDCINFRELITYIEAFFPDRKELEPLVERIFERLISQIIRKGFVQYRKRNRGCSPLSKGVPVWKTAWIALAPGVIYLWPMHKSSQRKTILLDKAATALTGPKEDERYLIYLGTEKEHLTLGHMDELARNTLLTDIEVAITHRSKSELTEYDRRRAQRLNIRPRDKEVAWRLALEAENVRLVQKLEEEHQSLRDEEIVRNAAARMLEECQQENEILRRQALLLEMQLEEALRFSALPENTTVVVDLERIEEEGTDEVEVIERDEEEEGEVDSEQTPSQEPFESERESATPYDAADELEALERARKEREQYLITSTQSI